jgi:hypothetical protein
MIFTKLKKNIQSDEFYKCLELKAIATRGSIKDIDKVSLFNIYRTLKEKYGKKGSWKKIELLYLTFYYFTAVDDFSADEALKKEKIKEINKNLIMVWSS